MVDNIFLKDLVLQRRGDVMYTSIGKAYRFGDLAHGGFVAALMIQAALEHIRITLSRTNKQHVTSFHSQYIKPVTGGEVEFFVEDLKVSKAASASHVVMKQNGSLAVTADIKIVAASANKGISANTGYELLPSPPPVNLAKLENNTDPRWIKYHVPYNDSNQSQPLAHWNIYMDVEGPAHARINDAWMRLYDADARITNAVIPVIMDSYLRTDANHVPKDDFSYSSCIVRAKKVTGGGDIRQEDLDKAVMATWNATQSLNFEFVRQLPPEGVKFVFLRAEGKVIKYGKLVTEVTILDEELNILAVGQGVDVLVDLRPKAGARSTKM